MPRNYVLSLKLEERDIPDGQVPGLYRAVWVPRAGGAPLTFEVQEINIESPEISCPGIPTGEYDVTIARLYADGSQMSAPVAFQQSVLPPRALVPISAKLREV